MVPIFNSYRKHKIPRFDRGVPASAPRSIIRVLRAYYVHIFFYDFIFGYAIYTAYFSLQGLKPTEIGAILAFWAACVMLLELPSGVLSDTSNRQVLLVVAPWIKALCFVTWALSGDELWLYALGFLFWSLGSTLRTGTKEALLYEHVQANRLGRVYEKLLGREWAFQDGATMLGAAVGGLIAHQNIEMALWLSVVPLSLSSMAALFLKDIRVRKVHAIQSKYQLRWTSLKDTVHEFKTYPDIRYLTVYVAFGVTFLDALEEFDQLFYLSVSLPIWGFGLVGLAVGLVRVVLAIQAYRLKRFRSLGWVLPALSGGFLILSGTTSSLLMLVPLVLAYTFIAPLQVLALAKFQKTMDGASRATTTSAMSLCVEGFAMLITIAAGLVINAIGVLPAYQIGGAYLLLFAFWSVWQVRKGFTINP